MLFRYTLCVPTLAGPIFAKKEHQKFGSDRPFGPLGVLTREDQTVPYQTAPRKLLWGLKLCLMCALEAVSARCSFLLATVSQTTKNGPMYGLLKAHLLGGAGNAT